MRSLDLTVVGASFAGLACAQSAARRGLRVRVLEAKPSAGSRLHTTGILVHEAAALVDVPGNFVRPIAGVRLYAPNLKSIDLEAPGYFFQATDLPRLMDWYADQAARAGASVDFDARFDSAHVEDNRVHISQHGLRSRFLVGADGAQSRVAQAFGLGANRSFLIGMEHEYVGIEGVDDRFLHVFIDSELAPGYIAWIVPGVDVLQVGLAATYPGKLDIDGLLERLRTLFDFSRAERVGVRGGLIPVGGRVTPVGRDRVLLVGDAAGVVSPLTAGGIHKALELGAYAGDVIADSVTDGSDPIPRMRAVYPSYAWKRRLRHLAGMQPSNKLINAIFENQSFRLFAQLVFFHHRGLLSREAWRDLRRLAFRRERLR